VRYDIIITVLM